MRSRHDDDIPADGVSRRELLAAAGLGLAASLATPAAANTLHPVELSGSANTSRRFAGKVVLITGATYGIGQTTAEAFAREGAKVAFCGRTEELGRKVEAGIRSAGGEASYMRADVREPAEVERFVAETASRYGRLDIAFNNAGVFMPPREVQDLSIEEYRNLIATNLDGVFYSMKYELPIMRRQGGGVIVNMASVSGHRGFAHTPHYSASKHGVIGLTKAAAVANAMHNIRIVSLSPLAVDTPMLRESFAFQNVTYEQMAPNFVTPRIMMTDEIARAVMFLASEESSFVAGMDLDVTGGQLA
ncbi:SDR family oxidoreductase [Chelativorans sp.]|uniref:SDR family NAD(P)-dependent oxidoreductase n=1 Tax=Chelativorans sp. TaxID=2203393 RepID=UPI002811A9CA|nr:SDR family oxidoreductase [Chelativorans sp.]